MLLYNDCDYKLNSFNVMLILQPFPRIFFNKKKVAIIV